MLVLTRKIEQCIAVGGTAGFENILKITVLEIRNGSVKLGFEVDASVPIHRWEVWTQICADTAAEGLKPMIVSKCLEARAAQDVWPIGPCLGSL